MSQLTSEEFTTLMKQQASMILEMKRSSDHSLAQSMQQIESMKAYQNQNQQYQQTLLSEQPAATNLLVLQIQELKSKISHKSIETIEDMFVAIVAILKDSVDNQHCISHDTLDQWSNASRVYPLVKNIKKAFLAEEISSEDEKIIKLSNLLGQPKKMANKTSNQTCAKCQRSGHTKASCYAKTTKSGVKIE